MPRKSATQTREPASLPEVPIPLSEVPESQRGAYQIALIEDPDAMKAALSQEDFFPMLANFPEAWWERMSLYLYRRPDDEGRMVKNEGPRKYVPGGVLRQPVDEEFIAKKWGGGKYTLYLKLDSKETLREHTFVIDGTPKVLPGQFVEIDGKPVSVGSATPPPPTPGQSEATQLMETSSKATEKSMEILADAAKNSIAMVREQAANAAQPPSTALQDALFAKIIEKAFAPPVAPVANPLQDKMMELMVERAFGPREEPEEKETPVEKTLEAIKELSGGMSLADLMKPAVKAAAADPIAGWAPIVSTIGGVVGQFLEKFPQMQAQRNEAMRLEIHLRTLQMRQPGQALPELPAAPAPAPQPKPQIVNQQPAQLDPAQLLPMLVAHIAAGFKQPPVGEWGTRTAAAMDFHFSNPIEAMGLADTLADPEKVKELVAGIPELAALSQDARWRMFEDDFLQYCSDRWGVLDDDEKGNVQTIHGEKPAAS